MTLNQIESEITLNQIAQGVLPAQSGDDWFLAASEPAQRDILRLLAHMILQARATTDDVQVAIAQSGLKPSYTPCVQLLNGRLNIQLSKVVRLPEAELLKSFQLLIALFMIADDRRRIECDNQCEHWWHTNLSDEETLKRIRRKFGQGTL
jgi:hypothetical protein